MIVVPARRARSRRHPCFVEIASLAWALHSLALVAPAAAQTSPPSITWNRALDQPPAWYASAEAVRIADNVLLYQHENGGWEKNIDMARVLGDSDRARMRDTDLQGGTTIDNGATW